MSRYTLNHYQANRSAHRYLIGAPLFIILLFCFSFVLLQPQPTAGRKVSASQPTTPLMKRPQTTLPAASFATTEPLAMVIPPAPAAANTAPTMTSTPQPISSSSNDLQAAASTSAPTMTVAPPPVTSHKSKPTPKVKINISDVTQKLRDSLKLNRR